MYKFVVACRLVDCGQYERALSYVEQAARAVTRSPRDYHPALVSNLAEMADRYDISLTHSHTSYCSTVFCLVLLFLSVSDVILYKVC